MAVIQMKHLLESGVHFGHQTRRWNPKMDRYIYTSRNGIHIIDLQQTVTFIEEMYERFLEISKNGGKVLFVGTKKQAQDVIIEESQRAGQFYVSKRWLGGTLTNFKTIRRSVRRLHEIEQMEKNGTFERLPKKEVIGLRKELDRLESFLGGIKDMRTLPEAVFIVDPKKEINAIKEARKLGIPVYGMADTNCDPDDLDYLIPANDDAIRSIKVIVKTLANALVEGAGGEIEEIKTKPAEVVERRQRQERQRQEADSRRPSRPAPRKDTPKPEAKPEVKKEAPVKEAPKPEAKPEVKKEAPVKEAAPKKDTPKPEAPKAKEAPVKEAAPKKDTSVDYDSMTVVELKELAKERGLTGYSKLRKAELIDTLKQ